MPTPFPGMDPYLEDPALWPDFQRQLVEILHQILLPGLMDRYRSLIKKREYDGGGHREENYLEIRQRSDDSLVTVLDIVSPDNKTTAAGRQAYLDVRRPARDRKANLAEIDLVLQGEQMLDYSREGLPEWHYAVTVTRATQPDRYEIYTATLEKRLPRFRLPLRADDRDTVVDLQAAYDRCCEVGGFLQRIDYGRDPAAPLPREDLRTIHVILESKGLREPHAEVALAAYHIWEQEGRLHGRDREHWDRAIEQLKRKKG